MAINYFKSTNIYELTDLLWDRILKEKKANPLNPNRVIIPNKNMRKWLNLYLAKHKGFVTNINYSYLENTLEEFFIHRSRNQRNQGNLKFPNQLEMQKMILIYLNQNLNQKVFHLLNKFQERPSKLFSLSNRLALLFRDYELNRREWIEIWWKEKIGITNNHNENNESISLHKKYKDFLFAPDDFFAENDYYEIEKKIYKELFLPNKQEPNPKTLIQWFYQESRILNLYNYDEIINENNNLSLNHPFNSLHIFCLSQLGYGFMEIFHSLSKRFGLDIYFYQFHSNFESSIKTIFQGWQKPRFNIDYYFHPLSESQNNNNNDVTGIYGNITPVTGLNSVKWIIDSLPKNKSNWKLSPCRRGSSDASVRFWNAPSVYREVESVFHDILHKLSIDDSLSYEDFAIFVTDMSLYKTAIEWSFDGGSLIKIEDEANIVDKNVTRMQIPYSLVDINSGGSSYIFSALNEIWNICKRDRIDVQSVKRLLSNPKIFTHLNKDLKISMMESLDRLNVKYEESNRKDDSFVISNGIRRLRLSGFVTDKKIMELFQTSSIENVTESLAITLTTFWEELISFREILIESITDKEWTIENLKFVSSSIENFLRLNQSDDEFFLFQSWKENLHLWTGMNRSFNQESTIDNFNHNSFFNIKMNRIETFEQLSLITVSSFQGITYQVGDYLIKGVNVSLLQPMRPIPFRHVYILGLGEGKFPGRTDRSELNLMVRCPIPNRDSSHRDIQESLFWEILHSAQDSIVLSYVGSDLKTNKSFEPCSTLANLMRELDIENTFIIPIHSYSKSYISNIYENSSTINSLSLANYDFSRLWRDYNSEQKKLFLSKFTDPNNLKLNNFLNKNQDQSKKKVYLKELIHYYQDPLLYFFKKKLHLVTPEEEIYNEYDYEIFHLDSLTSAVLIQEFYSIIAQDLAISNHQNSESWKEEWTESRILKEVEKFFTIHKNSANFPQKIFSKVQLQIFIGAILNIVAIWSKVLWGKHLNYIPYLTLGNTGLRKTGTKQIFNNNNELIQLNIQIEDRHVQILHEWTNCFQLTDNHWIWIHPKSLNKVIEYNNYFDYNPNYWISHSYIFFSMLVARAIGIRLTILNHNSLANNSEEYKLFGDLFEVSNQEINSFSISKEEAINYLKELILSVENEEIIYFSSMNFYRFAAKNKIKIDEIDLDFWEEKDSTFQEFLLSDKDISLSELPELLSIYQGSENFLKNMSLDFAKKFYKPAMQLYGNISGIASDDRIKSAKPKKNTTNKSKKVNNNE